MKWNCCRRPIIDKNSPSAIYNQILFHTISKYLPHFSTKQSPTEPSIEQLNPQSVSCHCHNFTSQQEFGGEFKHLTRRQLGFSFRLERRSRIRYNFLCILVLDRSKGIFIGCHSLMLFGNKVDPLRLSAGIYH